MASYFKDWVRDGYPKDMGSGGVIPPPSKDVIRVYHILAAEFAISNIRLSRMKVARFSDLNDPFELIAVSFKNAKVRKIVTGFRTAFGKDTGLLCFSANWVSPLLWGHYGAKHRGICLGFDLKRDSAHEVKYEAERLPEELVDLENSSKLDDDLKELLLVTKFQHWDYEKEYRYFVQLSNAVREGNLHFYPCDENLRLVEVILGARCDMSLNSVRELTGTHHPNAVTFKAGPANKFFKVVPDMKTVPGRGGDNSSTLASAASTEF